MTKDGCPQSCHQVTASRATMKPSHKVCLESILTSKTVDVMTTLKVNVWSVHSSQREGFQNPRLLSALLSLIAVLYHVLPIPQVSGSYLRSNILDQEESLLQILSSNAAIHDM